MPIEKRWSKVALMKDFFGFLPGQNAVGFASECKALSEADRLELARRIAIERRIAPENCDFPMTDAETAAA
jgi:hypothetical protein